MTLEQLYERASKQGIEIDEIPMRELRAVSFPEGWIAMDRRKFVTDIEYKCELAHEIGHVETGSFYNFYSPYDLKEQCEHKANKRAAQILMPLADVQRAMRRGYRTVWALAEYFEVTQEFAQMALDIYGDILTAPEAHHRGLPPLMRARDLVINVYDDWKDDVFLALPYYE